MKSIHKCHVISIGLLVLMLFTITACAKDNSESGKDGTTDNKGEVEVDSAKGEVTIPVNVDHIIAPYHEDSLLAFDVTPEAKWAIGESIQDYLESSLNDVPSIEWDLPLEQVLDYDPDLIILENNMDSYDGSYEDYQKIAPTYVMTEETTNDWKKQINVFGTLLDQEDEAETILDDYDEKVSDAHDELKDAIGDDSVAAIWVTGDQFFLFEEDRHSAEMMYSELDVNVPDLVKELGEAEESWNPISIEKLSELDADHIFVFAEEDEQGLKTLDDSSVWNSVPAVEAGNVYHLEDESNWTNEGIQASYETIDDLFEKLVD